MKSFYFKAGFTNIGLTRNVDICWHLLKISKHWGFPLPAKPEHICLYNDLKKKKNHIDNLSEYMLKTLFKTSVNKT